MPGEKQSFNAGNGNLNCAAQLRRFFALGHYGAFWGIETPRYLSVKERAASAA